MGALNIKDEEVAEKARRLAQLTGKSITGAVSEALDAGLRAASRRTAAERERREREVDEIVKRFRRGLKRDAPSPWKVMAEMYDDSGLPR
jgi:antitoxin VapB